VTNQHNYKICIEETVTGKFCKYEGNNVNIRYASPYRDSFEEGECQYNYACMSFHIPAERRGEERRGSKPGRAEEQPQALVGKEQQEQR
jgi:hypothetical protein